MDKKEFLSQIPKLDLSEGPDMLTDFSREAQRQLISARNSLLVLESVSTDKEAIENIFKTFHTIKGLADFLELHDICCLTHEAEIMLDLARKDQLVFDPPMHQLSTRAIDQLQQLLELLDDQIVNNGKLEGEYADITPLIKELKDVNARKPVSPAVIASKIRALPTISFEPDLTSVAQLEEQLKANAGKGGIDTPTIQKILEDFKETSRSLKDTQSKLQERQRELIRERELAIKLTQQAQTEARSKSEYLANMSHEIRTLINAILGFTDLLKESPLNTKQKEHLNTIMMSGQLLLGIVNDILDYAKVEAGKLKLEKIDFEIEHILEEVFKIIRTRINQKPINLYFYIDPAVPVVMQGDPTRLKQIFLNLLENAIKFTEQGQIGIDVKPDSGKSGVPNEILVRFEISDSGIGIPLDRQQSVFESFTQADASTTRRFGGTGLGLALCKNFVEKMGGKIWVESEPGKGSKFLFTLSVPRISAKVASKPAITLPDLSSKSVVVVDNHDRSAANLIKNLQELKIDLAPVQRSAKQASEYIIHLEKEKKPLPHLVFIDTMMPGKEGYMLAYKIRQQERYKPIKLVAVSSDVKVDSSQEFAQAGFDEFLPKPFMKSEIAELLERMFGDKPVERRFITPDDLQKISCEGIRVLVAEDSLPNQELLKVHFEMLKCVCDYVMNGQEAVEKARANDYDIIFMDLQMPIMGGIDAAKAIRTELKKNVPIIALTAAEIEDEREHCFEVGMNDYLPKPFEVAELKEKIIRCTKM